MEDGATIYVVHSCSERWPDACTADDCTVNRVSQKKIDSRCSTNLLVLLLLERTMTKQTSHKVRAQAYKLLEELVAIACGRVTEQSGRLHVNLVNLQLELALQRDSEVLGLGQLFAEHEPVKELWETHVGSAIFGGTGDRVRINSNPAEPVCIDLLMVLSMTAKHEQWWQAIGRPLLVTVAQKVASLLEATLWQDVVVGAEQRWPSPVKSGHEGLRASGVEEHQFATALRDLKNGTKLGQLKLNSTNTSILVRAMCYAHMDSTIKAFAQSEPGQWSFAWDPGLHSTQDTLVVTGYCNVAKKIAYAPPVVLRRIPEEEREPHPSVVGHLERGRNLRRQSALDELVALDLSLQKGFGIGLHHFAPPSNDLMRPLKEGERRVPLQSSSAQQPRFGVEDKDGTYLGAELPEQPPAWCTHWADQGSIGAAGINFLVYELGYMMLLMPDPNHRTWNDIKGALKRSKAFFYRTVVLTTLVFNLNYSPFLKGNFFDKKKEFYESWKSTITIEDPLFRKYAEGIAQDHGLAFPQTTEEWNELLHLTKNMKNCNNKGPLVKMMRPLHCKAFWSCTVHRLHCTGCVAQLPL